MVTSFSLTIRSYQILLEPVVRCMFSVCPMPWVFHPFIARVHPPFCPLCVSYLLPPFLSLSPLLSHLLHLLYHTLSSSIPPHLSLLFLSLQSLSNTPPVANIILRSVCLKWWTAVEMPQRARVPAAIC